MTDRLSVILEWDIGAEELTQATDSEVTVLPDREDSALLRPEEIRGADVFASYHAEITEETFEGVDDLRLIVRLGAGFDNVDLDACTDHGVVVTHIPQAPTEGVAQATIGLIIACANNIRAYDTRFRERGWAAAGEFTGRRLRRSTVGVVGMGQIGRRVIELLGPFDPTIKVYDPYASPDQAAAVGAELADLDEVLETSDFVTIHVPLTEETHGLLGADEFRRMKESAYLINTSRGGIYPDADLARAIREGWIAGGAIDVFEEETDSADNPLLELDEDESLHCVFTPHSVSSSEESDEIRFNTVVEAIESLRSGEVPPNVLNPEVYDEPIPDEKRSPSFQPSE